MNTSLLVSILIPVYNVERYLAQCLDSIVNQTYRNLQIVIIDDGSKDNSLAICQKYAEIDNRIEVYHQENQGVAVTRNHLLEKVKGEYVLFVDSDDWIEKKTIDFLLGKAIEYNTQIATCNYSHFLQTSTVVKDEQWAKEKVIKEFLRHVIFDGSLCNKLIKMSTIHNIKFHDGISYGEDALFTWEVLQFVDKVVVTNNPLYHYRVNQESLTNHKWTPEKNGCSSIVWKTIVNETAEWWPQYVEIAKARYAIEDMWGLYNASLAEYPLDKHIRERQHTIRQNLKLIRKSKLISNNKILACYAFAYWYGVGKIIKYTRRIKTSY